MGLTERDDGLGRVLLAVPLDDNCGGHSADGVRSVGRERRG